MDLDTFEFDMQKMRSSAKYLSQCSDWLAAGDGNLGSYIAEGFDIAEGLKIEMLDQTMQELKNVLRRLDSVRNELVPINRLPAELLVAIFECLTDMHHRPAEALPLERIGSSWPVIQSVCRLWRHLVVHSPTLWTQIFVSYSRGKLRRDLLSMSLKRSGSLPLTVYIPILSSGDVDSGGMRELVANTSRIRDLRVKSFNTLDRFTYEASALEVLVFNFRTIPADRRVEPFDNWQTPRLHTLVLTAHSNWHELPIRTLRHLILEQGSFGVEAVRGLHTLLSLNPRLEDLILHNVNSRNPNEEWMALDTLPSVEMPHLKRVSVVGPKSVHRHAMPRCLPTEFVEKMLILHRGCAKDYGAISSKQLATLFSDLRRCFIPIQKLFVGSGGYIITTDGSTSFRISTQIDMFLSLRVPPSLQPQVQELWLWSGHDIALSALQNMTELKKLVLRVNISQILHKITAYNLFPSLAELQLHQPQQNRLRTALILALVEKLVGQNRPVEVLRFVFDPYPPQGLSNSSHVDPVELQKEVTDQSRPEYETFALENAHKFEQLVPRVIFHGSREQPCRMQLPEICAVDSSAHSYWKKWDIRRNPIVDHY